MLTVNFYPCHVINVFCQALSSFARSMPFMPRLGVLRRYKRDLCYYFERNGTCVKGDDCTYAHGQEEQFRANVKAGDMFNSLLS